VERFTGYEFVECDDGVIEMRPALPVEVDQRWFWTERWQEMEQEADAELAANLLVVFNSGADLLEALAG
jgi:hypothetical protein